MFEITGDHIAELSEKDLWSLIGLLCEAEVRRANLSADAVTWAEIRTPRMAVQMFALPFRQDRTSAVG